ncbi:hypothetical protein B4064_1764 [Caldibacillus thermoamylovorans]|uniref:protoporphyrinogen/coproporphyrinogen oxidase n=1 Tax=Caldibacillus thermoamylovorans TaxID=35841 RepID=UPI0005B6EB1E|nr:FAD-dependent oxidoreductase [Caldibacillus thermoamylovorans]KIO68274.1 hypothetical protein B4064_1764 [Caldibacillus thermoamylovorans]
MKKVKYLIIGAGVSGLGFANFIKDDNYLILERENEAGGYCRTIYQDGYIWDYAGHFFHFATSYLKDFFNERVNQDEIIFKEKNTKIFYKGNYIDYPFQKNIHQLPKEEFIDCLFDLFNKVEKDRYNSFEEMLYGKFGASITEKFLKPYNEKLYACDLNELDADAMGRFFPYANIEEIINNMKYERDDSYNKEFLYPKKGAITFVNALLKELDEDKILYNEEVKNIDAINKVVKTNNMEFEYEYLINTAPFNKLLQYIDQQEYNSIKNNFSYNKVLVFNLGFDKKSKINDIHWMYIPDKSINFYRIGFYDNILDSDKLSMYVEIGYSPSEKIDINRELNLTMENLRQMEIVDDHKLVSYSSIIMDPAYVHITKDGQKIKDAKKNELANMGIYTIGRYGDWKYCSIEDSIMDALSLARNFNIVTV